MKNNPLSRKYYVVIAEAIARSAYIAKLTDLQLETVILVFARQLGNDNPRFSAEKFSKHVLKYISGIDK